MYRAVHNLYLKCLKLNAFDKSAESDCSRVITGKKRIIRLYQKQLNDRTFARTSSVKDVRVVLK